MEVEKLTDAEWLLLKEAETEIQFLEQLIGQVRTRIAAISRLAVTHRELDGDWAVNTRDGTLIPYKEDEKGA